MAVSTMGFPAQLRDLVTRDVKLTSRSDRDDLNERLEAAEVVCVAGVEDRFVDVRGGGDQEVHCASSRLTSRRGNVGSDLAVAVRDSVVHGKGIESALESTQAREPYCAHFRRSGYEDAEVELSHAEDTDGQLSRQGADVLRDKDARVQQSTTRHYCAQGSRSEPSS